MLTVIGKGFSDSEVAVANLLKEQGHSVVLRAADPAAGRMSDLLVDGMRWDVFTPVASSVNALPRAIAKKAGQAPTVIVDLRNTSITIEEAKAGNIPARVRGFTSQISDVKFVKTVG
ncbi:hypothetical protein [Mycobacteroides franklinii]|uniref:CdiA C-terminal domain-containing protein n=1 Tax=Mycobacteroides franklinii TaxID=948102 RepID=UPI0013E8C874